MARKRGPRAGSASETIRAYISKHPTDGPLAIQDAMAAQGLTVSKSLINNLKYGKNKVKVAGRRGRPRKSESTSGTAVLAAPTGARGEKADAIRAAFRKLGRKTRAVVVVNTLKEQGITVSPAQVATIKAKLKGKRGRPAGSTNGNGAAATHHARPAGEAVSVADLLAAKALVDKLGGVERATHLLSVLGKLL